MTTVWEAGEGGDRGDEAERLVSAELTADDLEIDRSLRPKTLAEYLGQRRVKDNLGVLIEAARQRDEPLDIGDTGRSDQVFHADGSNLAGFGDRCPRPGLDRAGRPGLAIRSSGGERWTLATR